MPRALKVGVALVAVLVVAASILIGGGWYLSNLLKDGALVPDREPPVLDLRIAAIGEGRVTLQVTSETEDDGDWGSDGTWGLEGEAGYDQVGAVLELSDQHVVREHMPLAEKLGVDASVRLDAYAFPDDPGKAFGLSYTEVLFSSPLGEFPAWLVEGSRDTWVIFVHGKGAERREALRIMPTIAALDIPTLAITYRNDDGLPPNQDGFYRFGQTEWEELQGAVEYAFGHGAEEIVLVGYSMGGAIVANFLYESPLATEVKAAILDAPMLDFGATVDLGARQKGYPGFFATIAKAFAGFRFGIDWRKLDYLRRADELLVPILLFHGDADTLVPVETSDALAEARPDLVKYVRVPGAGHVRSWNTDRDAYDSAVRDFLGGLIR